MVNLILDTQTWLYLANGFNQLTNSYDESGYNFKLLADLQKLKQSKKVEIFANDVLIEKWQRNKAVAEASIKKLSNSVDGSKNFLKGIKKLLSEDWQKIADDLSVEVEKKAMRKF